MAPGGAERWSRLRPASMMHSPGRRRSKRWMCLNASVKPKWVVHTTAGYLLGASTTHRYVFDIKEDDVFWCTADIGWVTGHSYIVYGPLANGTTTLMYEGTT